MSNSDILQFRSPKEKEPVCSGPEFHLRLGGRLDMAHFHTVITVSLGQPRRLFRRSGPAEVSLDCTATIYGREYDKQRFVLETGDIGKTLFCAGFPCLTLTNYDRLQGLITANLSEIVEPCEAGNCPWGDQ